MASYIKEEQSFFISAIQRSPYPVCNKGFFSNQMRSDNLFLSSNQQRFNNLRFEFDTVFNEPELPLRPPYVHDSKIGIVRSFVEAVVSKIPRDGECL